MSKELSDIIEEFIFQEDEELPLRLAEQEIALRETPCRDMRIGKWVDEYRLEYLFAALALSDQDFSLRFPEVRHVPHEERRQLTSLIKAHVNECPHCSLKEGYQLEWENRVKQACENHRQVLLNKLQEEDDRESAAQEGEHCRNISLEESSVII